MTTSKRTTMAITAERKDKLVKIAIHRSVKEEKLILWTDIVNELIDELLSNAIEGELKHEI